MNPSVGIRGSIPSFWSLILILSIRNSVYSAMLWEVNKPQPSDTFDREYYNGIISVC